MKNLRNKKIGEFGEEIAATYLKSQGIKILERNFKKRYSELDIVGTCGDTLVFVEVKTRLGNLFGTPEDAITPWKLKHITQSCQYYKLLHPRLPDSMRIDVVSVVLKSETEVGNVRWYKNITG